MHSILFFRIWKEMSDSIQSAKWCIISVAPIFHVPYAKAYAKDWPYHSVTHIHTECNCIQMRILHAPTRDTYFEICIATEYYWMKKKKKLRGNNKTWQQKTITDESDAEPKNDQNYEKRYQKYDIHFVWQKSHFIYSVNQSSAYAYTFAWFWIDNTRENNGE